MLARALDPLESFADRADRGDRAVGDGHPLEDVVAGRAHRADPADVPFGSGQGGEPVESRQRIGVASGGEHGLEAALHSCEVRLRQLGDDALALEDCQSGLALQPDDADLMWLQAELRKPAAERFQGAFKQPPSSKR